MWKELWEGRRACVLGVSPTYHLSLPRGGRRQARVWRLGELGEFERDGFGDARAESDDGDDGHHDADAYPDDGTYDAMPATVIADHVSSAGGQPIHAASGAVRSEVRSEPALRVAE